MEILNIEGEILDPKNNKHLYRFIPVYCLVEIFSLGKIALMRTSVWKNSDPFEGFLFDRCIKYDKWSQLNKLKQAIFCLCLSIEREKDQLWRAYIPDNLGVRIKIDSKKLQHKLSKEFMLGKVKYRIEPTIKKVFKKYIDDNSPSKEKLIKLFFYKRKAFESDREVRLLTVDPTHNEDIKFIAFDPHELVTDIMFHPAIPDSVFQSYKDHISSVFNFQGKIHKSKLYEPDKVFGNL